VAEEAGPGRSPTEEELLAALDKIGVADVLVQAAATSISIGFRRVSEEARDLPQARLAIEALRALEPVLRENGVDDGLVRDLEQARANLQLAYASAVAERPAREHGEAPEAGAAPEARSDAPDAGEAREAGAEPEAEAAPDVGAAREAEPTSEEDS
jgi:hypothetical protein